MNSVTNTTFDELPLYILTWILINSEYNVFKELTKVNKILYQIAYNKLPQEIIQVHGNLTNILYYEKSLQDIRSPFHEFREDNMTWRVFYWRTLKEIGRLTYMQYRWNSLRFDKLFETKIYFEFTNISFTNSLFINTFEYQSTVNDLAKRGKLDIIQYIEKKIKILPDDIGAGNACAGNQLSTLKYLVSHNPPILPHSSYMNSTLHNGNIEICKFLASLQPPLKPIFPNAKDLCTAYQNKKYDVLKYYLTILSILTFRGVLNAIYCDIDNNILDKNKQELKLAIEQKFIKTINS